MRWGPPQALSPPILQATTVALAHNKPVASGGQARPVRKLHVDSILFGAVEHFLRRPWSPEQIALAPRAFP